MYKSYRFNRSMLAVAVSMVITTPIVAESQPALSTQQKHESVVVYGSTYRNTATKSALEPQETPQGISVIDQETLDMRGADTIGEALRYVSGVTTELRGGAVTRFDQFTIRGFRNDQNFYDGLQLLGNGWNLQPQIDAVAVEQVEVFKGPTSVLYGAMPPGGMVNLIAKAPSVESYNSINISAGNQNLREVSGESRGQITSSDFSYSIVGLARKKDAQAVTSEEERYVVAPSVDWQMSDNTVLNLHVYYQKDPSAGIYNTVPAKGSVNSNVNGRLSTDFYAGDANWSTFEREFSLYGFKINHQFNENWTFLHSTRYMDADVYQENTYNAGLAADERTLVRRAYLTDEVSRGVTVDNQLSGRFSWGAVEHNILIGVDYLQLTSGIEYEDAATDSIDLFDPDNYIIDPASLDFAASGYSSEFDIEKEHIGTYFQDQMLIGQLVLIAGGRYDEYKQSEKGVKYGAEVDLEVDQYNFSGRLGGLYQLDNGFSPFISYAESFEPEPESDRHGNSFDPTTAHQWETGVKYESQNNRHNITVSLFELIKENDLTRDPAGTPYDKIQTGEVRSRGVELEVDTQPFDNLTVLFNYTQMDMEVTKDNSGLEGKTPIWVADRTASLWLNYGLSEGAMRGFDVGLGVRYVGETQLDALNTDKVPGFSLVDLALTYDLGTISDALNGMTTRVTANNVFDERYTSCYDENNCWFGAERTVEANINFEF
ncbi:ligand-gated channel protein [Gammaproteobacteria bacterium 45_16_T64]|nr:ligand-gated channel protein [Gammaproteobacteria bacterium 45_16_T64]